MTDCLAVDGLVHSYGDRTILNNVSFTVRVGEIICLLGRSGCGKTTLLRLVAGLESPREGIISVMGRVLTGPGALVPPEQRAVGLMFQDYALFPHLTALENARFGMKPGGPDPSQLLARVGLSHARDRYPHTMSAGEQQRAALVRALASSPVLLLMDEPFSNLDTGTRESVRETTLALLRETGATALIVTHDPAEAMQIADRIVLLNEGRIEQIGTPSQIYRRPASLYAARYFSDLNTIAADTYVRPHDVRLSAPGEGLPAKITRILDMGEHMHITLDTPSGSITARVAHRIPLSMGQDVGVIFAQTDLLSFDKH